MVRRSSRLRDKARELTSEVSTVDGDKKDDTKECEDLENLVRNAYALIKQKVEDDEENADKTREEDESSHKAKDYLSISSKVKTQVDLDCHTLASELNPGLDKNDLYFNMEKCNSKPIACAGKNILQFNEKQIMKKCVITPDFEKKDAAPPMRASYNSIKKQKKIDREKSAGSGWFHMPAPEMTSELKRDLNIIRMRGILDPKRHYKKDNSKKLPKYFQIGTVVSGPAEFYSSRVPKSQRKGTIIESLLSDAEFRRYNKRKYLEIQATKQAGKKNFHRRFKKKRR